MATTTATKSVFVVFFCEVIGVMGDKPEQRKVHPCKGEGCKNRISSYDPHTNCNNCRIKICTKEVRCHECWPLSDEQWDSLEAILKDNIR